MRSRGGSTRTRRQEKRVAGRFPGTINRGLKKTYRRQRIVKMGMHKAAPRYHVRNGTVRIVSTENKVSYRLPQPLLECFNGSGIWRGVKSAESMASNGKIIVTSQSLTSVIKNQSDVACYVKAHLCYLKKDITTGMIATNPSDLFLAEGWTSIGATDSADQPPGVSIMMNPKFREWVKVLKTRRFIMQPAATRTLTIRSAKVYRKAFGFDFESTLSATKGTKFFILEMHGVSLPRS